MDTSTPLDRNTSMDLGLAASPASRDSRLEPIPSHAVQRQVILDEPQRLALEWLASSEKATVKDAAEFAGVGRATVFRWIADNPDFCAVYTTLRQQRARANDDELLDLETSALDVLGEAVRQRRDVRVAQFLVKQANMRRQQRERAEAAAAALAHRAGEQKP